jgi:hypothetical protein
MPFFKASIGSPEKIYPHCFGLFKKIFLLLIRYSFFTKPLNSKNMATAKKAVKKAVAKKAVKKAVKKAAVKKVAKKAVKKAVKKAKVKKAVKKAVAKKK